jgi:hypothetical protein
MYFDRFDIVEAYFWWLSEHYDGQWSLEYKRLCKIMGYFHPSSRATGPSTENSKDIYDSICAKKGCIH